MSALEVHEETETERVERWRQEELVRAGYKPNAARRLASNSEVDLHKAIELVVKKGCNPVLAARIMA